ncbi:MAG: hypothetical protein CMN91_02105 [Synechococcus sp. ARS1019]|nr:hypothetical protein [Synechococcus sp. ARS1019]|tara:strand:+ start:3444 stop:3677 length:234 start_codon:yes stop_codon:yes gene_type:complete
MEIAQLRAVLSDRMGQPVMEVFRLDGSPAESIEELYEPMPAGFRGQLLLRDGSRQIWDLWQEDGDTWNFSASPGGAS